ncbi:hypothetical protein PRIPAC_74345 [Pristionchus pacificus]|uniref:Uncharacterized protein n=1 Tax=Pristionchus pacificus TaxID=54126 RepID=A0A2A6D020_PRIPA|nr:hypothetical protein PRIPAC_74345 [Pristionchus pacificus]|eukprot:PDM83623.1 hypothetical protein PRIPAC_30110 [Pristionchus pacificus]
MYDLLCLLVRCLHVLSKVTVRLITTISSNPHSPVLRSLCPSLDRSWGYGSLRYSPSLAILPPKARLHRRSSSCVQWEEQRVVRGPASPTPPSSTVPTLPCECCCQRFDSRSLAWTCWATTSSRSGPRCDCPSALRLFRFTQGGSPSLSVPLLPSPSLSFPLLPSSVLHQVL